MRTLLSLAILGFFFSSYSQTDTSKFNFEGDFRFRLEEDWDSRKSDGTMRDDRTRLRYRVRAGVTYEHDDRISVGLRLRTGFFQKQQDPQLTLGDGFKEFGTLPFGLEKAYFQFEQNGYSFWLGKNSFPFAKQNELFWSDNVYPEGIAAKKRFEPASSASSIDLIAAHFVINARGSSLSEDTYMQGFQASASVLEDRIRFAPALYLFGNVQNIPDGAETFLIDYSIAHISLGLKPIKDQDLILEADYYVNLEDYGSNDSIPNSLQDEKIGYALALGYGSTKAKGDWLLKLTYNYQERYSAVDFLNQNDWARWDYSSTGSLDGRLTNYQGIEAVGSYMAGKNTKLTCKYYLVEQLVAYGDFLENGSRIRFDLDIAF